MALPNGGLAVFYPCVAVLTLDGRPDQLLDQLSLQVEDDHSLSSYGKSLFLDGIPLLPLSHVGQEADDGVALCE